MNYKRLVILLFVLLNLSCGEKDPTATDLLTSKVWGKPEVLHHPTFGHIETNSCDESYQFLAEGSYLYTSQCNPGVVIDGEWAWTKKGSEIRLETFFNDIPQDTSIISILELTDDLLHTKTIVDPLNETQYWELKYRAK